MKSYCFVLAALAAALSTAAFAGDRKPVQMTDKQMDQVTAGSAVTGTPSTVMTIDNGQTSRTVGAGSDNPIAGLQGPGGDTFGNQGNTLTSGAGGNNLLGTGPGGGGLSQIGGSVHGGCGGGFSGLC